MLQNRQTLLFVGDILILAISFFLMVWIRFDISAQQGFIGAQLHLFGALFILWLIVFFIFDLYNLRRINPNPRNIGLLFLATAVNVLLSVSLLYVFPVVGISPKTNLLLVALFSSILLVFWRRVFYNLFTKTFKRSILLIGTSPLLIDLVQEFKHHPHLGDIFHFDSFQIDHNIPNPKNLLFITESAEPKHLTRLSQIDGVEVLSLSDAYKSLFGKIPVELITDEKAVEIITKQQHTGIHYIYRLIEIVFATLILLITSPVLLLALLAIGLEDGKPFFLRQKRVGKNGELFTIYKLRTMRALAPDGSAELAGAQWADQRDPRITRTGNILRKTHIDEIPQMWNIIKGDIALVGPRAERPELVSQLEKEIPYYFLRHSTKPGFTGWAQIKFRYARTVSDSKEKFEYDLYYLSHKNPLLDFGIVLKTLQIIFTH